jgi:hypothetical protein
MQIDSALLSSFSALFGALIGGGASFAAAVYTQRYQDRLQRIARETAKREEVYADFIMKASTLLLKAHTHDELTVQDDPQELVGLLNRMRLFAPPDVIDEAEVVIRKTIEVSLKPRVNLKELATAEFYESRHPDLLHQFSLTCRADLDHMYRTIV